MIQPKESNSKTHFQISLIKSMFRLAACVTLYQSDLVWTALLFGAAEVLGIAEEIF
jgi:hypothetical protein